MPHHLNRKRRDMDWKEFDSYEADFTPTFDGWDACRNGGLLGFALDGIFNRCGKVQAHKEKVFKERFDHVHDLIEENYEITSLRNRTAALKDNILNSSMRILKS